MELIKFIWGCIISLYWIIFLAGIIIYTLPCWFFYYDETTKTLNKIISNIWKK